MNRKLSHALKQAERKAWDSLSRYKFLMFGYHAPQWVTINRLAPTAERKPNPFRALVKFARAIRLALKELQQAHSTYYPHCGGGRPNDEAVEALELALNPKRIREPTHNNREQRSLALALAI